MPLARQLVRERHSGPRLKVGNLVQGSCSVRLDWSPELWYVHMLRMALVLGIPRTSGSMTGLDQRSSASDFRGSGGARSLETSFPRILPRVGLNSSDVLIETAVSADTSLRKA